MQEHSAENPAPSGTADTHGQEYTDGAVLRPEDDVGLYGEPAVQERLHAQTGNEHTTGKGIAAVTERSVQRGTDGVSTELAAGVPAGAPVDREEACVRELDVASRQHLPSLGLCGFYREKCKENGTRVNPLVLECLIIFDKRSLEGEAKDGLSSRTEVNTKLNIACCGNDKRIFCQRLDDRQLIPLVHTLALSGENLRSLDLSYNVLTNNAAVSLSTLLRSCCPHIEAVNLQSNCISGTGCASLCEAFTACKNLEAVNFSFNPLRKDGALAVAKWLETNSSVKCIRLNSCELDAECMTVLTVALTYKNTTLQELDVGNLTHFSLEPHHCYYLSGMFECNSTLTEICLAKQSIGDEGTKILVPVLKANRSVVKLDLSCNKITFYGGRALRELLSENSTLKELNLNCNRLAKYGARFIAQGLGINRSLVVLRINNNSIPPAGLIYLAEAAKINTSLIHMDVAMNDFNSESAEAYRELLGPQTSRPVALTLDFHTYTVDGTTFIANIF